MGRVIRNEWRETNAGELHIANIACADTHPEGLDIERLKFFGGTELKLDSAGGDIISVAAGQGTLRAAVGELAMGPGTHAFVPPSGAVFCGEVGADVVRVRSRFLGETTGTKLVFRDERFVYAASSRERSLRWILTPQYLSRRVFLRHDKTIVSKSGAPVSWFHTTMFDVAGLPRNDEGLPVFKMSYNSRTEINVCYDVAGVARVRMAKHPYSERNQLWTEWAPLDGETAYHLDEPIDDLGTARNKHEVHIDSGHVSLFCLFDPAPVGFERHRPGEYTDYEPFATVAGTREFLDYCAEISLYDTMVDELSLARARGEVDRLRGEPAAELYRQGFEAQIRRDTELHSALGRDGTDRQRVIEPWLRPFSAVL
jgi:hypothetical protein